jgi:hypothetical protein
VLRPDGQPAVVWDKNGNRPLYCRLAVEGADIAGKRERFKHWWDALVELTDMLGDSKLIAHDIVGIGCAREPWITGITGCG